MHPDPQNDVVQFRKKVSHVYRNEAFTASRSYLFAKRMIDILAASAGLILLAPLLLVVAICIKLEDPKGSVFFRQSRVGKDEKRFYMYKFRSMVSNAEQLLESLQSLNEMSGAMFKMKEDPRVTRLGRFIRKTSIDELPQLWNVLKGNMSLVGPRPPLPKEVEEYMPYHKLRLLVQPGCTGLWQVSARNSVGFEEMVELDLQYIQQRSVIMDIGIILKTIWVMLWPKNAY